MSLLIGIDQGTSGTTVIAIGESLQVAAVARRPVNTVQGDDGKVEQDPWHVLETVVEATREVFNTIGGSTVGAAGLGHQGETVIAWDRQSLQPLTPAIVWSDRRATAVTDRMVDDGRSESVRSLAGTRPDPYFCAAKYRWILEAHPNLSDRGNDLALGTLDTWLLAQLGVDEATDIGTASRTQLTSLGDSEWNADLLEVFGIDEENLAPIVPSLYPRGEAKHNLWPSSLPLKAVTVDQPAALVGNGCLTKGALKVTYGTGAFVVVNLGRERPPTQTALIPSVGWGDGSGPVFNLDGGVLAAGSGLGWLSRLGVDVSAEAQANLIDSSPSSVLVLPGLDGLGAPHWDRGAAATIGGLTSATTEADLLRGYLDSIAFRVREILDAARYEGIEWPEMIRVDGGLARSQYLMQKQADVLGIPLAIGREPEATALGAAFLAGLSTGSIGEAHIRDRTDDPRLVQPVDHVGAMRDYERWSEFVRLQLRMSPGSTRRGRG